MSEMVVVRKRSIPRVKRGDIIEMDIVGGKGKFHVVNATDIEEFGVKKTLLKLRRRRRRHRGR